MLEASPNPKVIPIQSVEESLYEVRRKIYSRSVSGIFARWRIVFVLLTQILFYGLPWLSWNDRQAVLFQELGLPHGQASGHCGPLQSSR